MKPTYYVRAAPQHPAPHAAFSAFSIQPARHELFDVAHVILVAEAVACPDTTTMQQDNAVHPAPISQQTVALFYAIMQQEIALPVVRRLIEALRQTNTVLHRQQKHVRILVGLLIKESLYLACVGNVSAYVIRDDKVTLLLSADRTRDRALGHAAQLLLDYQIQALPHAFVEQKTDPTALPADHFVLAPSDTLILCASELTVAQIKPALRYARRPEWLAATLAKATAPQQAGQVSGVVALHWHVDKVGQAVKQLGLVLLIFLCVTFAMQLVIHVNQRIDRWMTVYAKTGPVRQLSPLAYGPAPLVSGVPVTSGAPVQTVSARTLVTVHVNVNLDDALPTVADAFVPTFRSLPTSVNALITLPILPVTPTPGPTNVPTVPPRAPATATVISTVIPTVVIAVVENSATPVDVGTTAAPLASSASALTDLLLLSPPAESSSVDAMTFAWQSDLVLPPGQAYEVIIWQNEQNGLVDGLGIAAPTQEQHLTVQFQGLYTAGVMRPGAYQWGVLLVTVEPYTRITLLGGGRTFYFAAASQSSPACDPDRESC